MFRHASVTTAVVIGWYLKTGESRFSRRIGCNVSRPGRNTVASDAWPSFKARRRWIGAKSLVCTPGFRRAPVRRGSFFSYSWEFKDIDMYFIKTLSCCVSVFFFGREIDFLGSEWLLKPTRRTNRYYKLCTPKCERRNVDGFIYCRCLVLTDYIYSGVCNRSDLASDHRLERTNWRSVVQKNPRNRLALSITVWVTFGLTISGIADIIIVKNVTILLNTVTSILWA